MSGDYSRNTFVPKKRHSLVRMQQGRLFTDADWNEQGDLLRASDRDTATDVIGQAGFPEDAPGFALGFDAGLGAFTIGPGLAYVGGVRLQADAPAALTIDRVSGAGVDTTWRVVEGQALGEGDVLAKAADGSGSLHRITKVTEEEDGTQLLKATPALTPQSLSEVWKVLTTDSQPDLPEAELPTAPGAYLAYLKTFELAITALDDPAIREVAFDGPDTATRDRTLWQVGFIGADDLKALNIVSDPITCASFADPFQLRDMAAPPGALAARAKLSDLAEGPCTLPPAAGYRSLENQLYRVEVHTGGLAGAATYKWSRDNAIHRTRYDQIDAGVLSVESAGRDDITSLKAGDWIEIRNRAAILAEAPGHFARIGEVNGKRISLAEILHPETLVALTTGGQPDTGKLPGAAFVTRWEGGKPVAIPAGSWEALEHGVEVQFTAGIYEAGDYWTIPARSVTGDVDWPTHSTTGAPETRLPEGVARKYAALALVTLDNAGGWTVDDDCRRLFAPLTAQKQFLFVGGDGQEAMPDPLNPATLIELPHFLTAAVVRGKTPVEGERVRFRVVLGDGRFANAQDIIEVATGADGVAAVKWSLDGVNEAQRVEAEHLDAGGNPTHTRIVYNATLSRADRTSFDPKASAELAGANTVQLAIERLVGLQQIGCTTYIITPDSDWVAVLEALQAGENASICFVRGTYETDRTVALTGLGEIKLSGAGPGAVKIIAKRRECALSFTSCTSVSLTDLALFTPDGIGAIPESEREHRAGTVTFTQCGSVSVEGCRIECGAGPTPQRTCVTVRAQTKDAGKFTPVSSALIRANHFSVGYMQEGVLVTDTIDSDVSANTFTVRRRPASLIAERLLHGSKWGKRVVNQFVANPVKGSSTLGGNEKTIQGGVWRASFVSPVPQREWNALMVKFPPLAADIKTQAKFTLYAKTLIKDVVEEPARLPSYDTQIKALVGGLGNTARARLRPKVRESLLISTKLKISRFDKIRGKGRNVVLDVNGAQLAINSPISQGDWTSAVRKTRESGGVRNADDLLVLARRIANRMIRDPAFRRGLPSVTGWLSNFTANSPSVGAQAIVCAGRRLDTVRLNDNIIRGFNVGIRVATSHRKNRVHSARSVEIDNNRLQLLALGPGLDAPYGLFVGNAETLRIRGNDLSLSQAANSTEYFAEGVRVFGFVGHYMALSQNRISLARIGIRIQHCEAKSNELPGQYHWVLSENLFEGPKGMTGIKATPSNLVIDRDNRTFS